MSGARLSVLRTANGGARLQVQLHGSVAVIELSGHLARAVGGRLMMAADPFLLPVGSLPITEVGRIHVGVDGAVEVLGCRLEEFAEFDPVAGCDLRLGLLLADRGVEAYANAAKPTFGFLDDLEGGAPPVAPWNVILEKRVGAAAGEKVAGEPLAVRDTGLGAGAARGEGVLVSPAIDVRAEVDLDVGPRGSEPSAAMGDLECRRGDAAAVGPAFVDNNGVTEAQQQRLAALPRPQGVPADDHAALQSVLKSWEASAQ